MRLSWFNTKELDEFADTLVARLIESYPPSSGPLSGRKAFERLRRLFGGTFERIDGFVRGHRLNLYKKAHFANRVRWSLLEAGYPREFVDTMTEELVAHLTLASRGR
jgi:hypothetical protein